MQVMQRYHRIDLEEVSISSLGCSSPNAKNDQGNGHFRFSTGRSKFSKARCARREPQHVLSPPAEHIRRRCMSPLQLSKRSACASLFICQKRSSSAASSPALQLEQTKASTKRREQESMRMQQHRKKAALVAGCSSLWTSPLPPTFLPKGNAGETVIFAPTPVTPEWGVIPRGRS